MKAADTIADLGEKLQKPVKRSYCPRNKSFQDSNHSNPKSLVYFKDETLVISAERHPNALKKASHGYGISETFFAIQASLLKISISSRNCKSPQKEVNNKEINPFENLLKAEVH